MMKNFNNSLKKAKLLLGLIIAWRCFFFFSFVWGQPQQSDEFRIYLELASNPPFYVGQPVRFSLITETEQPGLQYRYNFGDGSISDWIREKEVEHVYLEARTYEVVAFARFAAEGRRIKKERAATIIESNVVTIRIQEPQPRPQVSVHLEADRHRIRKSQSIRFRAFVEPSYPNVLYNFTFGDGRNSGWINASEMDHTYENEGGYKAVARARIRGERVIRSNIVTIFVEPRPLELPEIEVIPSDYKVYLEADKLNLIVGESVGFEGGIEPGHEEVEYNFTFGEGTHSEWLSRPVANHTYRIPGIYYAALAAKIGERTFQSNEVAITVEAIDFRMLIEVEPNRTTPAKTVVFRTMIEPYAEGVEYQFIFGDGEMRDWARETVAEHIYSERGTYRAFIRARRAQRIISESEMIEIIITGFPPWGKWAGIIAGLALALGLGYNIFSRIKKSKKIDKTFKSKIQLRPQKGISIQDIESETSLQSNFEIRLRSVTDKGEQDIEVEDSLIIDKRRNHE